MNADISIGRGHTFPMSALNMSHLFCNMMHKIL